MYKEYNIWDENLDLDEWVPDATTAALVYRIATATGRRDINVTGYRDTEGEEFDRLSVDELNDLAIAEQTRPTALWEFEYAAVKGADDGSGLCRAATVGEARARMKERVEGDGLLASPAEPTGEVVAYTLARLDEPETGVSANVWASDQRERGFIRADGRVEPTSKLEQTRR